MIKVIIFDNGGVIVFDAWKEYKKRVKEYLGLSLAEVNKRLTPIERGATKGNYSFDDVLNKFSLELGTDYAQDELITWRPITKQIDSLLLSLKEEYKLALLTNELGDFNTKNNTMNFNKYFDDDIFASSVMKMSKPDTRVFQFALKSLGVNPDEAVFVDDKSLNLKAASALGINVIQFKSVNQLKRDFGKIIYDAKK